MQYDFDTRVDRTNRGTIKELLFTPENIREKGFVSYSGAEFDPKDVAVSFQSKGGTLQVCVGGQGVPFDEDLAKEVLGQDEVTILVTLTAGQASCSCWGCDLTYDYVKINGDYRS